MSFSDFCPAELSRFILNLQCSSTRKPFYIRIPVSIYINHSIQLEKVGVTVTVIELEQSDLQSQYLS